MYNTINNKVNSKLIYKKDKISNKILLSISNIILNTIVISISLYIKQMQFENWLLPFAVLSLIQLIINVMTIVKLEEKFFSLTVLFLIFSFITHLGILIIFGFQIDLVLPWNPLNDLTSDAYRESCYFTVFCHAFLTLGMCIVLCKRNILYSHELVAVEYENRELYLARKVGTILFFIGIFPLLYYDVNRIILYINGGYISTYEVGVGSAFVTISRMTEVGAMLLLIGNYKNKKRANFILIIILFYQSLILYTGNRGRPVMYLIVVFFIYYNFIKKIKLKEFIKILVALYFASFLITFIGSTRSISMPSVNNYIELLKKSFFEFSIFKLLAEFGVTVITLGHSLVLFPSIMHFQLGTNYLISFLTVLPNVSNIFPLVINKIIYVYNWPLYISSSLGGSYLGEIYYSFGKISYIFTVFIGMMVAFVSNQINKFIIEKHYVKLSIYLLFFIDLLWWIRDYFGSMVRECVWIPVTIIILYKIFYNKLVKDQIKDSGGQ